MALMNVLIVDDSSTSRHHIRQVLEKLGFEHFCEAASSEAAIPYLEQEPFKLIITDYHMPGMDGWISRATSAAAACNPTPRC
ncbi:Chemotaxis protein CheY [Chromobacterium violaceum]|uniref:Chemotaxis protein CheY n=1 Tax=Chromobacterium violaceum TaxID=536 RepID=A0A3S4HSR3_CHRVL|nr:Chemotaxis protein CheY [Chromobacterium violaceum]